MVDIHAERHVCRFSYEILTAAHGGLLGCDVMQTGRSQCFRGTIDIDREKPKKLGNNLSQCHFVHPHGPRRKPVPPW
jgi:hypothetical protein